MFVRARVCVLEQQERRHTHTRSLSVPCVCVQHINELTMRLDVQMVLRGAEAIYLQLTQCQVSAPFRNFLFLSQLHI